MAQIKPSKGESSFKSFMSNLLVFILGLIVAMILSEIITRIFLPVFPGIVKLDENGAELVISTVEPNSIYRQYSQEFDVITTITKEGYRVPEASDNPDIIFIGDSFTFGQGLKDDDTFVMRYCKQRNLSCMNLGVPGSGTIEEIDRLEEFLTKKGIKPKKVILSMMVMTSFLGSGNDLNDNLQVLEYRTEKKTNLQQYQHAEASESMIRKFAEYAFRYSNLARVMKFYFLPIIKNSIVIAPEKSRLQEALSVAKDQLNRLEKMSKQFQFKYQTVLFYPVQDITRGTHLETTAHIQAISPITINSSADVLLPNPSQYYFSMDGHFNEKGSKKIVELLLSLDK